MINKNIFDKIFITLILSIGVFILSPQIAKADVPVFKNPELQVPIGVKFQDVVCKNTDGSFACYITWISDYISGIYQYGLLIGGILAAIVLMAGGLIWLTSGGDVSRVTNAKKIITGGLVGLLLLFGTYIILNTINPELVKKKAIVIEIPEDRAIVNSGDCMLAAVDYNCCEYTKVNLISGGVLRYYDTLNIKKDCPSTHTRSLSGSPVIYTLKKTYAGFSCGKNTDKYYKPGEDCIINTPLVPPSDNWLFQETIKEQVNDASPELRMFINCIRKKVPANVGIISSISDSKNRGHLDRCNKSDCCKPGTGCANPCAHACQSCHYGGGSSTNMSYAVDFGDEENVWTLIKAGKECGSKYEKNEGDHIHMSVAPCPKN